MFLVGREYQVTLVEVDDHTTYGACLVVSVEMPLVKFEHAGKEMIVNTSSPVFAKAELLKR